jgi:hypothetical protein
LELPEAETANGSGSFAHEDVSIVNRELVPNIGTIGGPAAMRLGEMHGDAGIAGGIVDDGAVAELTLPSAVWALVTGFPGLPQSLVPKFVKVMQMVRSLIVSWARRPETR